MQRRLLLALAILSISNYSWSDDSNPPEALLTAGEYQQALAQIDAQLKAEPDDVKALFFRAIALGKLARSDDAIAAYQQLIEEQPSLPEPHNNLAVLYALQGDYQAAEQVLQAALKTHPSYAAAHNNLSSLYRALASIAYNKALNLNNGNPATTDKPGLIIIEELRSYQPPEEEPVVEPTLAPIAQAITQVSSPPVDPEPKAPVAVNITAEKDSHSASTVDMNTIEGTVKAWSQAWSQQDSEAYLAFYSEAFRPTDKLSRSAWAERRKDRLQAPTFIQIDISQLEASVLSNEIVSVNFHQRYLSDRFQETARKLLLLKYEDNQWRILQETEMK